MIVCTNPNDNYEIFITLFQLAKNKHLPMKSVRCQKRKHKKSKWMTSGILNSINTKDGLYKTLLKQTLTPVITKLQRTILSVTEKYCTIV